MTTEFLVRSGERFRVIKQNLRGKEHGINQGSYFLRGSFSNRDNVRTSDPIWIKKTMSPSYQEDTQSFLYIINQPRYLNDEM